MTDRQIHTHTHSHMHTRKHTHYDENITPLQCHGGVKHFKHFDIKITFTSHMKFNSGQDKTKKSACSVKLNLVAFKHFQLSLVTHCFNETYSCDDRIVQITYKIPMPLNILKGIYNPKYLPNDFFALTAFLDDLKSSHLNLSIQICPQTPQPEIG